MLATKLTYTRKMEYVNTKLKEFEQYLCNKKVAVIGLGVSNLPLIDYLHEKNAKVTVFDEKNADEVNKDIMDKVSTYSFETSFGKKSLEKLQGFDMIFRSPSCLPTRPELEAEAQRGAIVTTEIEMLMKLVPCKVIGVTGSDGKTTTTTLIYNIMTKAGFNCFLGGNIGIPLFTKVSEIKPDDIVILELSSFQLMNMKVSPDISVITNITPNHLNIHKDYAEYIEAKKSIFKNQDENGILILNYDNEITRNCAKEANGKVIFFSSKEKLDNGFIVDDFIIKKCEDKIRKHIIDTKEIKLRGMHNFENICTALAATSTFVDADVAIDFIKDFAGVEHRLELVKEIDGVKWYNDSVSSSPTRTIAGLKSYDEEIVLIAGGYDKKLDYTSIAKPILDKVKVLILIGQTANKIFNAVKEEMENQNKKIDIYMCDSLSQTVVLARKYAKPGQVVLFSPASASFDMFKNFADRGEKFKKLVLEQE
jgi:UDP-N-acetylmuramoylalanine--D-glutamate ligase